MVETPYFGSHGVTIGFLTLTQCGVQLPYSPVLLPCSCVAATPYNPRAGCTGVTLRQLTINRQGDTAIVLWTDQPASLLGV